MSFAHRLTTVAALMMLAACGSGESNAAPTAPVKANAAAATKPAKPASWLDVVVATPDGGIRQGNPNAKVKLLEFGSLTCSHCGAFAQEGVPTLRAKYIATGRVSYEYRPFLLNGVDFAPSLLVRCQPPTAAMK